MPWTVSFAEEFKPEFEELRNEVQDALATKIERLKRRGPSLGRPTADTLDDSKHANMKELRFDAAGGVWRVAFAFDPARQAILLVCGNKAGKNDRRFYRELIKRADARYDRHLAAGRG